METISKIMQSCRVDYNWIEQVRSNWISNGCWWKGWFNFSKYMKKLEKSKYFKNEKAKKLAADFEIICDIHDNDFSNWDNFIDFIIANLRLANNSYKLLHWYKWLRTLTFLSISLWTTLFWYKYFKKWKN